uniref:Uncharacterized protein n=1 Tax=Oryza brachyantha TaxID=4533 RepID=J3MXS7_ORYBR
MGLLDQLWDDTVAGPRPDSGLGKLRNTSIPRPTALSVTSPRSESSSSTPSSPASVPDSPFGSATTPKGEAWKKMRRRAARMADGVDAGGQPRSPTVYDWSVA